MAPEQFGRYRLEELIGVGGMGEVHRAVDTEKDRVVAVKRLTAGLAADPDYRARFRREARLVARLAAPHVIPIHDYGEIDGRLFLEMPLVRGVDGAELVARTGALPAARAVEVVAQVAEALDAAHAAGLVHRDVKPSNVLVTGSSRDFVYLIDFGLVHDLATSAVTATGGALGTLAYMAPERLDGRADHRVDVYSLACVLHELLTGTRPYPRDTFPAMIYAHLHEPAPRPSVERPGLPAGFDDVVARGMAKDPEDRFASAGELAAAAREALDPADRPTSVAAVPTLEIPRPGPARPPADPPRPVGHGAYQPVDPPRPVPPLPSGPTPVRAGGRRRRIAVGALLAALLAAVGLAVGALVGTPSPPPAASPAPAAAPLPQVFTAPRPVTTIPLSAVDVELSPDGALAYVAGEAGVEVLDTTTHAVVAGVPVEGDLSALAVAPDGAVVYAATYDPPAVHVVDTATLEVTATVPVDELTNLAVSADGSTLYGATFTAGTLVVLDTAALAVRTAVPVGLNLYDVVLAPDGRTAYVSGNEASTISVVDLAAETVAAEIPVGENPGSLALSADGARLYAASNEPQEVAVIDTARRAVVTTVRTFGVPTDLVVSGGGRWIYVTDSYSGSASVLDATTDTMVASVPFGSSPVVLTLHPTGRRIYAVNIDEPTISVLDVAG